MHLHSLYMILWLRVKGYDTFWPQAQGYTTFHPGAKGYATFWFKAFPVQGRRARRAWKVSLCWTGARSNFSAIPKVSHAARRTHVGPKGPHHGDGGEGRGGVGCAEGAPLLDISSLNHYISLTPIGAPPAGAHRTHKLNRNTNEEQ